MNLKTPAASLLLALAFCVLSPGCRDEEPDYGGDTPLAGDAPVDDVMRTAVLRDAGIPVDVRTLILADLGEVQMTNAEQVPTETGGRMYRVTYIQGGQAQARMYSETGQRVIMPEPRPAETIDPVTAAEQTPPAGATPLPDAPTTRPAGDTPSTRPAGGGTGGPQ